VFTAVIYAIQNAESKVKVLQFYGLGPYCSYQGSALWSSVAANVIIHCQ